MKRPRGVCRGADTNPRKGAQGPECENKEKRGRKRGGKQGDRSEWAPAR